MKKKGRGLSFDEKREKMLKIFINSKSIFNYDEIEKYSIKAGIPFPSVKEILNSLKADSLIQCEKIGAGVFYWSFPSKTFQIYETKIAMSQKQIEFYQKQIESLEEMIQKAEIGRQLTSQRDEAMAQLEELQKQQRNLTLQIEKYIRFDPERVELLRKQNRELKQKVNFWTDNLEQFKKYVKKNQVGTTDKDIENQYGIPEDLDYVQ